MGEDGEKEVTSERGRGTEVVWGWGERMREGGKEGRDEKMRL